MKRFFYYILPPIAWFIISTILFTLPGSSLPKEDWLDKIWIDKWVHIGLFATMVFLLGRAGYQQTPLPKRKRYFITCCLLCIAYGVAIEFIQKYFIPNRSFDLKDIAADSLGSILGAWYCTRRYIKE